MSSLGCMYSSRSIPVAEDKPVVHEVHGVGCFMLEVESEVLGWASDTATRGRASPAAVWVDRCDVCSLNIRETKLIMTYRHSLCVFR